MQRISHVKSRRERTRAVGVSTPARNARNCVLFHLLLSRWLCSNNCDQLIQFQYRFMSNECFSVTIWALPIIVHSLWVIYVVGRMRNSKEVLYIRFENDNKRCATSDLYTIIKLSLSSYMFVQHSRKFCWKDVRETT